MCPRFVSRSALLCLLGLLCLPALSQQPLADAPEISRELLYHPAYRIEKEAGATVFRSDEFTYRLDLMSNHWEIRRERNFSVNDLPRTVETYRQAATGNSYRFEGSADDNRAVLEIRSSDNAAGEPLARVVLWTRKQLANTWRAELLNEPRGAGSGTDLDVADPEVAAVADDGSQLWLAIRFDAGEGEAGLGSLVRFNPQTNETRVFRSTEVATSSITQLAVAGGMLWLGTMHEGEGLVAPTAGLVRFDPSTGKFHAYRPGESGLVGNIITALDAEPDVLWLATDAGMCRLALAPESWKCWRIVPTVRLAAVVPVSSRPGGAPRRRLPAGTYQVRWTTAGSFEVITPDATEGWMKADDFGAYTRRQFDARAFELANTYGGGSGVMRLLEKPDSDPLNAAQVYRAPLERVSEPNDDGWLRVRARVGWIPRGNLEVTLEIQPAR